VIAVVDYGAGNLTSVLKGLTAAGADARVTDKSADLHDSSGIVVPGVGHFSATGSIPPDVRTALATTKPILGICLGMQLLFAGSEEAPDVDGLELVPGRCRVLTGTDKVPHVGWNTLQLRGHSELLEGVADGSYVYFTHSYAAPVEDGCVATTSYGESTFAAVVDNRGVYGVQFHPEKSGDAGMRILRNFVSICSPNG
jgi:glutamine amidotransferase